MAESADIKDQQANSGEAIPSLRYRPRGRIVAAADIEAWQTGQSYLAASTREAERLQQLSAAAFEAEKKRGFEEGRKEGAALLARLLAETTVLADRHLAAAEQQILDLALAVVRRVLGDCDPRQLIQHAVIEALTTTRQGQRLTLQVAPTLAEALRDAIDAHFEPAMRALITVEPDARLDEGQCRLASDIGFVDLGIDAQLTAIHQGLTDALSGRS